MKLKIFLIVFVLSLPFWLEEFLFQQIITRNPEFLTAQANQLIFERKLEELRSIRIKDVEIFQIEAEAAISILIRSDQAPKILFKKNIDEKLPIASLVKLMTAHVVLEYYNLYDLSQEVKISKEAVLQEEEFGKLKVGQIISVEHLLYPLLIESSNDASFALAEIIGQKEFVNLMNSEAERLGLKNTYFINPTGLDPNELTKPINSSTVRDLTKFAEYLLKHNLIWEILSTEKINLYGQTLVNTNQLLGKIPGIIGGRTGWTLMAGGSLLLVLQVPEGYLINIILGAPTPESRFEEMKKLIDWTKSQIYGSISY